MPLEDRPDHTPRIPVSAERRRVDVGGVILEVLRFAEPPHALDEPEVSARGERGAGNQRAQENMSKKRRVLEPKLQSVLLLMRRSGSRTGLTEAGRRGPLLLYPSLSTSRGCGPSSRYTTLR